MGRAPIGDQLIAVAIANRAADRQKQNLAQGMSDTPGFARVSIKQR